MDRSSEIHLRAQSAFFLMQGTVTCQYAYDDEEGRLTVLDGVEEFVTLLRFSDVGVDEEGVDFGVDVLPAWRVSNQRVLMSEERQTNIMIWKP